MTFSLLAMPRNFKFDKKLKIAMRTHYFNFILKKNSTYMSKRKWKSEENFYNLSKEGAGYCLWFV
jgi:hypothetical protein